MSEQISYHYDIEQGSDEWLRTRMGIITASDISKLITPSGKLATNEKTRAMVCDMVAQRTITHIEENFQSFDMMRGHIQEGIAREIYETNYAPVKECGFITNNEAGFSVGCSPDGLVGDNGGIEIKSRLAKFQIKTIIENEVPDEYMIQIQTNLFVSGREWWDFVQYSNGMPFFVKRVYPDPAKISLIIAACNAFYMQVDEMMKKYNENSASMIETEYVEILTDEITESTEV